MKKGDIFVNAMLTQHNESDGNYNALVRNTMGHYEASKKASILPVNVTSDMLMHEEALWLALTKQNKMSVTSAIEHLRTIYMVNGIQPTTAELYGKYTAIDFLTDIERFVDITSGMTPSYWKK